MKGALAPKFKLLESFTLLYCGIRYGHVGGESRVIQHELDVASQALAARQRIDSRQEERRQRLPCDPLLVCFRDRLLHRGIDALARHRKPVRDGVCNDEATA